MREPGRWLIIGFLVAAVGGTTALAQLPGRKPGPFGDKPAGPQSLPGDNLPPFNVLDASGKLVPMPKLDGPLHKDSGGPESSAPGPNLDVATKMARAAVDACKKKGFLVGATVIDSVGEARAMLTADGSDGSHVFVAHRKALTALVFGTTSLKANQDVTSGAAPMSKVTPDMFVMGGGVPIFRDGKLIGAIGVSGAAGGPPPGKADEDCAYAGLRAGGIEVQVTASLRATRFSDQPWLVVLGSTLALTVGNGPIMQFTFGVFLKPLTQAFGIERGLGSLALTIGLLATAFTLPIAGKLADVWGPRRLGLIAVVLFAAGVAAAGLLSSSIWIFMVLFALAGVAAAGQTPLVYLKAISALIDRRRGLALSIALTGVGIGSIAAPIIAQRLIGEFGWRGAYVGLAAILLVVAVPSLLAFIPGKLATASADAPDAAEARGLTPGEALRTGRFWLLVFCLFLGAAAANGTIAHVVPLLTDRGVTPEDAAGAMGVVGAAAIVGRLLGGYLIDRFWAPIISTVFFVGMIAAIGVLIFAQSVNEATIATVLLGLGLGVEADLVGFLVSRYLGTRAFGTLFGYAFASFMLGSSLGPILMGAVFDVTGSYALCQMAFMGGAALAAIGLLTLGRYAYPAQR